MQLLHICAPAAEEYLPRGQGKHDPVLFDPGTMLYLPGSQSRQTVAPASMTNLPFGHCSHWLSDVAWLSRLNLPSGQFLHSVLLPSSSRYVPARQTTHSTCAVPFEYLPFEQLVQLRSVLLRGSFSSPFTFGLLCVPAAQVLQDVRPGISEYRPSEHILQPTFISWTPPISPYLPAGHPLHDSALIRFRPVCTTLLSLMPATPVRSSYLPLTQATHKLASPSDTMPASHSTHLHDFRR